MRIVSHDGACRFDTVHSWHVNVHHHDIGFEQEGKNDRLLECREDANWLGLGIGSVLHAKIVGVRVRGGELSAELDLFNMMLLPPD